MLYHRNLNFYFNELKNLLPASVFPKDSNIIPLLSLDNLIFFSFLQEDSGVETGDLVKLYLNNELVSELKVNESFQNAPGKYYIYKVLPPIDTQTLSIKITKEVLNAPEIVLLSEEYICVNYLLFNILISGVANKLFSNLIKYKNDGYIDECRFSNIFKNFGTHFNLPRLKEWTLSFYSNILKYLYSNCNKFGLEKTIKDILILLGAENVSINYFKETPLWKVYSSQKYEKNGLGEIIDVDPNNIHYFTKPNEGSTIVPIKATPFIKTQEGLNKYNKIELIISNLVFDSWNTLIKRETTSDIILDTSEGNIVTIISVSKDNITYVENTDYKLENNQVVWLVGGSSPGSGESYKVEYKYTPTKVIKKIVEMIKPAQVYIKYTFNYNI